MWFSVLDELLIDTSLDPLDDCLLSATVTGERLVRKDVPGMKLEPVAEFSLARSTAKDIVKTTICLLMVVGGLFPEQPTPCVTTSDRSN